MVGEKLSSIRGHPRSARLTLSAAEHCRGSAHTCPVIEVRLSCSEFFDQSLSFSILPVAKDMRRRTGLKSSHIGRSELAIKNAEHEIAAESTEILPQARTTQPSSSSK
jgi:hypothetical protein